MDIRIIGNDIELGGEKVARIFDVRATLRSELESLINKADTYDEEIKKAYDRGHDDGTEEEAGKRDD
jgi:hypothetical protein|tara:strand:- start:125 stop:325 length:201 start_codon:yes stop_codon:yes gene_type:complete